MTGWLSSFKRDHLDDCVAYAMKILDISFNSANAIWESGHPDMSEEDKKASLEQWFNLEMELVFFYLHFTWRHGLGQIGDDELQSIITDVAETCIWAAVEGHCRGWPSDLKERIKHECTDNFHSFMQEYNAYSLEKRNASLSGTLFWEFSENISKLTGQWPNPGAVVGNELIVLTGINDLEPKAFIEKVK